MHYTISSKNGSWKKVVLAVSDNVVNTMKAIAELLKLNHFGCLANTINLRAKNSLEMESVDVILEKMKQIVDPIIQSTTSAAEFVKKQKLLNREPNKT